MEYKFNVEKTTSELIKYIRNWMDRMDPTKQSKIVIGISGGKDSTIVAKLCCEAIGVGRVLGVLLPNGYQSDLEISKKVCDFLGIKNITININDAYNSIESSLKSALKSDLSIQTENNLPPRLRMSTLFAVAQTVNGFVVNTSNLSEDWIGWATYGGDSLGAFGPISMLTCSEVVAIGDYLNLPEEFVHKKPSDGLTGRTDEDNFGFTYETLDKYIRTGICEDETIIEKINRKHIANMFKISLMDVYTPTHNMIFNTDGVDKLNMVPCETDKRYGWM